MGTSPPPTSSSTNSMATRDSRTGGGMGPRDGSSLKVASETMVGTMPRGLCFISSGALKWYQFSCWVERAPGRGSPRWLRASPSRAPRSTRTSGGRRGAPAPASRDARRGRTTPTYSTGEAWSSTSLRGGGHLEQGGAARRTSGTQPYPAKVSVRKPPTTGGGASASRRHPRLFAGALRRARARHGAASGPTRAVSRPLPPRAGG